MEKVEQRSDAWFAQRCGKLTASRVSDALATIKTGESAYRRNLKLQLLAERLTGVPTVTPETPAMRWGAEQEPMAKIKFSQVTGLTVEEAPFVEHPLMKGLGASPDGYTSDGGLVEIKCPQGPRHIENILSDRIPREYIPQLLCQLSCTGKKFVHWVSFHPLFPDKSQIKIIKFQPSEEELDEFEGKVYDFLEELNDMEAKLRG